MPLTVPHAAPAAPLRRTITVMGLLALTAPALAQPARYRVVDLGTVPGALPPFTAEGISEDGTVVGSFAGAGFSTRGAFLSPPGAAMVDLGVLPLTGTSPLENQTEAYALNSRGEVVGKGGLNAFMWRDGAIAQVGPADAIARDINEAGRIAGAVGLETLVLIEPSPALLGSEVIQLPTFGGRHGEALAINEFDHAAGWASDDADRRMAALWRGGEIVRLGELDPGANSEARALNDVGEVVGMGWVDRLRPGADRWHAFHWDEARGMIDLGNLPEAGTVRGYLGPLLVNTTARSINNIGQIVGDSSPGPVFQTDPGRPGPWIWEDGVMTNLNDLIDPASGWIIESAAGINDAGWIAASARLNRGDLRAVRLELTCIADCDESGVLDVFDFLCFQDSFVAAAPYADCDASGSHDFFDFLCFQNVFAAGCP